MRDESQRDKRKDNSKKKPNPTPNIKRKYDVTINNSPPLTT